MNTNFEKYKWGLFYFDPKDSRIIVPKVTPYLGWTFNFGNPYAYLIIVGFITVMIVVDRFLL